MNNITSMIFDANLFKQLFNLSDEVFDVSAFQGLFPFDYGRAEFPGFTPQAWASENIVLVSANARLTSTQPLTVSQLTDGLCSSACAFFV
jgi:hypothetical protein